MRIGILSDTHNEYVRTRLAVKILMDAGAQALFHCGDLSSSPIIEICSTLPLHFVFGNHDSDTVPELRQSAMDHGAVCLEWGGIVELAGKRIGMTHGHMRTDTLRVLAENPDYLLFGHSHYPSDSFQGSTRRINPGAIHRSDEFTVATLDIVSGELQLLRLPVASDLVS